jgi:hypothetical protein
VDFDVFLVDCYFAQEGAKGTAAARRHGELMGGLVLHDKTEKRSRWNAPWDIHDFLLGALNVNVEDIPTVDVLAIPREVAISPEAKDAVIENFLRHAKSISTQ